MGVKVIVKCESESESGCESESDREMWSDITWEENLSAVISSSMLRSLSATLSLVK